MSTKATIFYGDPREHGKENDYHLYYDYADLDLHLEINGREVPLPPKLRWELLEAIEAYRALRDLVARMVASAESAATLNAWRAYFRDPSWRYKEGEQGER